MDKIQSFWTWFALNEARFRKSAQPGNEKNMDLMMEHLHQVDAALYFEIGYNEKTGGDMELVVTPEGNPEKKEIVRTLIANAPKLKGWKFIAFKPPLGLGFKTKYEGVELDPETMWFLPLKSKDAPDLLGLRLGVETYSEGTKKLCLAGSYIVLDTVLGEERVMEEISYVEVGAIPENAEKEGYIEFVEIEGYLDWSKSKR